MRFIPSIGELRVNLTATLPFLLFRMNADEGVDPSRAAALNSFKAWWIVVPYGLISDWLFNAPMLSAYKVNLWHYYAYYFTTMLLSTALGLMLVYWFVKLEKAEQHFPRLITVFNWTGVWSILFSLGPLLLWKAGFFSPKMFANVNTFFFLVGFCYAWFIGWRIFRLDPMTAIGVPTLAGMPGMLLSDYAGLKLFGVARPFFEMYPQ